MSNSKFGAIAMMIDYTSSIVFDNHFS